MRRFWRADQQRDPFDFEDRITPRPPDAEDDLVWNGLCWTDMRVVKSETERLKSFHAQAKAREEERQARQVDPTVTTSLPPPHVLEGEWPANLMRPDPEPEVDDG